MRPLLTLGQLSELQHQLQRNFTTPVVVKRPKFDSDELGDDAVDTDPPVVVQPEAALREEILYGWLHSSPTAEPSLSVGQLLTANTYGLGLPIEADVKPRDIVVIGGTEYRVTDTTTDETWPLELACSLRLGE